MESIWILLALIGWALAILLVFILMKMSGDQQRAARRNEIRMNLHSEKPGKRSIADVETGDSR